MNIKCATCENEFNYTELRGVKNFNKKGEREDLNICAACIESFDKDNITFDFIERKNHDE